MATIELERAHDLPVKKVQDRAEEMALALTERFEVECWWEEDTLCFERPGVEGKLAIEPGQVRFSAELGLLLLPLKGMIEAEVNRHLDKLA